VSAHVQHRVEALPVDAEQLRGARDDPVRVPQRALDDARLEAARAAADAWECAVEWSIAPDYARRRLAMLRERRAGQ
jgi:hypothetical protein